MIDQTQKQQQQPQTLSTEEQRLKKMYGRLPSRADLLNKKLQDRKYFDSGDYALSQAGVKNSATVTVGSEHPYHENDPIPAPTSTLRNEQSPPLGSPPRRCGSMSGQGGQGPISGSPPKIVGDPQAYTQHTAQTKTPGTVPILSPIRDRSSSLSPPDADIANEAVQNYNQKLAAAAAAQRMAN